LGQLVGAAKEGLSARSVEVGRGARTAVEFDRDAAELLERGRVVSDLTGW
jgi:hypothetical protein